MKCSASYGLKVLLRVFVKLVSQYIIQFQLHSRAPEFHNILLTGSEQKKKHTKKLHPKHILRSVCFDSRSAVCRLDRRGQPSVPRRGSTPDNMSASIAIRALVYTHMPLPAGPYREYFRGQSPVLS